MKAARELLRLLTQRFPPPRGENHALLLLKVDGREEFVLALRIRGAAALFTLEEADFTKTPEEIACAIGLLEQEVPKT